jgi:hypothetical protein
MIEQAVQMRSWVRLKGALGLDAPISASLAKRGPGLMMSRRDPALP